MATLTFPGCNSPEQRQPRGALLRLLDTLAEWQMRHSHSVIRRIQTGRCHHQQRDPAVQRERALQHQALRSVGGNRRVGLRCQDSGQHHARIRHELPRHRRGQPLQRLQQDIRQHQIERRPRDDLRRAQSSRLHSGDECADAVQRRVGPCVFHGDRGRCRSPAPACGTASPPRSPGCRSRCRDRGCGVACCCAPARPAPAGSRAWCRDGRCRTRSRPRSRWRRNGPARGRGHGRRARRSGRH